MTNKLMVNIILFAVGNLVDRPRHSRTPSRHTPVFLARETFANTKFLTMLCNYALTGSLPFSQFGNPLFGILPSALAWSRNLATAPTEFCAAVLDVFHRRQQGLCDADFLG